MAERKTGTRTMQNTAEKQEKAATKQEKPTAVGSKSRDPENTLVTVVLNVTVPDNTAGARNPVFVTGTMSQINKRFKDWDPKGQKMKRVDNNHWTITFSIPENSQFEYKYTLGDWDHVERDMYCNDVPNHKVAVNFPFGEPITIDDEVQNWTGVGNC